MKLTRLIIFILIFLAATFVFSGASAEDISTENLTLPPIYMSLFYGDTCPHCHDERVFLEKLQKDFSNIKLQEFEIYNNSDNAKLMGEVAKKLGVQVTGVPLLVIGNETIVGYRNDATTGKKIRNIVESHSRDGCTDVMQFILNELPPAEEDCAIDDSEKISLPLWGELNINSLSLPVLTVVIGILDGFNPCSMWVLLFLISLVIGMQNRRKMWLLGGAFILASALAYFLFLAFWLNLFYLFAPYIKLTRIIIGIIAIGGGIYYLREWQKNKKGVCKTGNHEQKRKTRDRLKELVHEKSILLALIGIIFLAFAVNLVELGCSAGFPAVYIPILGMSGISPASHYLYLLLYTLFFMFDDIIVFTIAMTTLKIKIVGGSFAKWSNLIGGVVILILGIILIFKPGLIMFG